MDEPKRPKPTKGQTSRARAARKNPSAAEDIVWSMLRDRKLGFKFKREVPFGKYRGDLYCAEAKVVLEMDGEQHDPERDAIRDEFFNGCGVVVFRIPNIEFFQLDPTLPYKDHIEELIKLCEQKSGRARFDETPHPQPPLPEGGEGTYTTTPISMN